MLARIPLFLWPSTVALKASIGREDAPDRNCGPLRKLATTPAFLITLALTVVLDVIAVVVDAAVAGKNGAAPLGTTASTNQMLKLGAVCCVATLVLGIVASGGEYRHRTIIPAMLVAPRRGTLVIAKTIALAIGGVVLASLTFGLGLATIIIELSAHGFHQLPPGTARLFADSVIAATLFGLSGNNLAPAAAIAVLGVYTLVLLAVATQLVRRRDVA